MLNRLFRQRAEKARDGTGWLPATLTGRTHFRRPIYPERAVVPAPGPRSAGRWSAATGGLDLDHEPIVQRGRLRQPVACGPRALGAARAGHLGADAFDDLVCLVLRDLDELV